MKKELYAEEAQKQFNEGTKKETKEELRRKLKDMIAYNYDLKELVIDFDKVSGKQKLRDVLIDLGLWSGK